MHSNNLAPCLWLRYRKFVTNEDVNTLLGIGIDHLTQPGRTPSGLSGRFSG